MARDHVTVVLSGDGGDELFGGYTRYLTDQNRNKFSALPPSIRKHVLRSASSLLPRIAPGKNYLHNISLDPIDRYVDSVSAFNSIAKRSLYSQELGQAMDGNRQAGVNVFREYGASPAANDAIGRLLYLDSKTYLPGDILTKVDRMTMANSIEARAPFLDHELIELVTRMPSSLKIKGGQAKYILKRAVEEVVPKEILFREKQGFGVPVGEWINDQLRDRIADDLGDRRTKERGYFNSEYVGILQREHATGRRDHSHSLWMLWMLELWFRRYIDA